jgi:putative cell wall-binding protein
MDSRDGNVETDDMGIYLAQANLNGSPRIPVRHMTNSGPAELAIQLSQLAYPGGPEAVLAATFATRPWSRVVIVNERDLPGALAAGVLGRAFLGPVLVTPQNGLSAEVKQEVQRLAPIGAYVIGSQNALSNQVVSDLASTGIPQDQIIRLVGTDRAGTAALIAKTMDRRSDAQKAAGLRAFEAAVIVNPASPDAASVSAFAANRRLPVLTTTAGSLPPATAQALKDLGIIRTIVIGTSKWVSDAVLAQLPKPQRIGGHNAVMTSRAVLAASKQWGLPTNMVFSAKATRRMDAAVMGAAVGRIGGLLLLSPAGADEARAILDHLKMRTTVDHLVMAERKSAAGGR